MLYSINVYIYLKIQTFFFFFGAHTHTLFLNTHEYKILYNYPTIDPNIKSEYFLYITTVHFGGGGYTPTCESSSMLGDSVVCLYFLHLFFNSVRTTNLFALSLDVCSLITPIIHEHQHSVSNFFLQQNVIY